VAWCYDAIAKLYSGGAIAEAKVSHLAYLDPGDRVLYCGVGRGEDALRASRLGAAVTAIDLSPRMLEFLARSLEREALEAERLCGDVFDRRAPPHYDAVVANFFLNVFGDDELPQALAHLTSLLRPGGRLMLADFIAPRGDRFSRALAVAYYRPVNVAAWLLGLCALHPMHDYADGFAALGLRLVERRRFSIFGSGPAAYESLIAERIRS
jgi:demethylmenaquinone methyltransferase/2-methoxy-6-polyprenyl-1,4-benzoquinol methylase